MCASSSGEPAWSAPLRSMSCLKHRRESLCSACCLSGPAEHSKGNRSTLPRPTCILRRQGRTSHLGGKGTEWPLRIQLCQALPKAPSPCITHATRFAEPQTTQRVAGAQGQAVETSDLRADNSLRGTTHRVLTGTLSTAWLATTTRRKLIRTHVPFRPGAAPAWECSRKGGSRRRTT